MEENRPPHDPADPDDSPTGPQTAGNQGHDPVDAGENGDSSRPVRGGAARETADADAPVAGQTDRRSSESTNGESQLTVDTGDDGERPLRKVLHPGETLDTVRSGTLVGDAGGPATVGLTDGRFVVVTDAGEFVTAGFGDVTAVRRRTRGVPTVRGNDARLLFGVGYVLALFAFVGVLASAANPFTPMLTLLSLGGILAVTHVRNGGLDVDDVTLGPLVDRLDDERAARFGEAWRRITAVATEETLVLWGAAAVAVLPFLVVLGVERGLLVPAFALVTVASLLLVVHAFHHGDDYDGIEFDWHRQQTVTASLADGTTVSVQTPADSDLDRKLAGRVGATSVPGHMDIADSR